MGKLEKKESINKALDNLSEPILEHVLAYIKELENKIEEDNLNDFILTLNQKYSKLLSKLAK